MLQMSSAMKGFAIGANDGTIGTIADFLFDQTTWTVRWLVIDTGGWLSGRKVLLQPSAVDHIDLDRREIVVGLTRKQVEDSPDSSQHRPVSQQMQNDLYSYYGWNPMWGGGLFGAGMYGGALYGDGLLSGGLGAVGLPSHALSHADPHGDAGDLAVEHGDPKLRSIAEVTNYHVHASDGSIGHVEHALLDLPSWSIRYFVVDTSNWWLGKHVLISPFAIREIDWSDRSIRLDVSRAAVKASPPWNPEDVIDTAFERQLHDYYGWPGYRW